jgi:hypothetical protein
VQFVLKINPLLKLNGEIFGTKLSDQIESITLSIVIYRLIVYQAVCISIICVKRAREMGINTANPR